MARDWIRETPEEDADIQKFFTFVEGIYEESHRLQHVKRQSPAAGKQQYGRQHILVNAAGPEENGTWKCLMNCGSVLQHDWVIVRGSRLHPWRRDGLLLNSSAAATIAFYGIMLSIPARKSSCVKRVVVDLSITRCCTS